MRIVHYYPPALFGSGGAAQSVKGWAEGMAEAGADVVVATDGGRYGPQGSFRWADVTFAHPRRVQRPSGLEDVIRAADVLILHSGWTLHNVWAARIARKVGVPYVITPHGSYAPEVIQRNRLKRRVWMNLAEHRFLQSALALHLFFEAERDAVRSLGFDGPVITAPNGVAVPEGWGWDGGSGGYLLWMGRFDVECKGLDVLTEAVALLPDTPLVRLHGPESREKNEFSNHIRDRNLQDRVVIGEHLGGEQKWATLAQARGFVFLSRWDAHSIAVMEAAALGVPLLLSQTTAIGRMMSDKGAGRLVSHVPAEVAAAFLEMFRHDGLIGARGRALIRESFTWPAVAGRLLSQLRGLL